MSTRVVRFHPVHVLALVASLTACSSNESGGASDASSYAKSFCDLLQPCCVQAGMKGDMSMCSLFAGGQPGYDAAAGERCLSTMRARAADGTLCGNVPPCNDVFRGGGGSVKPGGACTRDTDCASADGIVKCQTGSGGKFCQVSKTGKEGSSPCIASVVGPLTVFAPGTTPEGFSCADTDGLTCDATTKACKRLGTEGARCTGDGECALGFWCDSGSSTCKARAAAGAKCTSGFDDSCVADHKCEGGTCVAQGKSDAACAASRDCASGNCNAGKCGPAFDLGYALLCGGS